ERRVDVGEREAELTATGVEARQLDVGGVDDDDPLVAIVDLHVAQAMSRAGQVEPDPAPGTRQIETAEGEVGVGRARRIDAVAIAVERQVLDDDVRRVVEDDAAPAAGYGPDRTGLRT